MTTYYLAVQHSRWCKDDAGVTTWTVADDAALIGFTRGKIILATMLGLNLRDTQDAAYKLQWRDVTANGSFADVAATGAVKWATSVVAGKNDGDAVAKTDMKCTNMDATMTWQDGLWNLGDNLAPDSSVYVTAADIYTEFHWALDFTDALAGHLYELLVYNVTAGASAGTCQCRLRTNHILVGNQPITGALTRTKWNAPKTQAVAGLFRTSGLLKGRAYKALRGTLRSSGLLTKGKIMVLSVDAFLGTINKAVAGGLQTAGNLAGQKISGAGQLVAGILNASGALTKEVRRTLVSTLISSGAALKRIPSTLLGALAAAGNAVGQKLGGITQQAVGGSLNLSGVLTTYKTIILSVDAFLGTINKAVSGGLQTAGGLTTQKIGAAAKAVAGALGLVGSLTTEKLNTLAVDLWHVAQEFAQTLTGGLRPSGAVGRLQNRLLTAVLRTSGLVFKRMPQRLAGVLRSSGKLLKRIPVRLAGLIAPSGIVTRTVRLVRLLTGGLRPSGVITKILSAQRVLGGLLRITADLIKSKAGITYQPVGGILRSSGQVLKRSPMLVVGILRSSGATSKRVFTYLLSSLQVAGDVAREKFTGLKTKTITGLLAPAGALTRLTYKGLLRGLATAGTVARNKVSGLREQTISGVLRASGAATKQTRRVLSGTLFGVYFIYDYFVKGYFFDDAGILAKQIRKGLSGALASSGVLFRRIPQRVAGTLRTSGKILRALPVVLVGILRSSGAITKQTRRKLAGILRTSGLFLRRQPLRLAGVLRTSGTILKRQPKALAGLLRSSGLVTRFAFKAKLIAGVLRSSGVLVRQTRKITTGLLRTSGVLPKRMYKLLAGGLQSSGLLSVGGRLSKQLTGVLRTSGAISRRIRMSVAGTLELSGSALRRIPLHLYGTLQSSGIVTKTTAFVQYLPGFLYMSGRVTKLTFMNMLGGLAQFSSVIGRSGAVVFIDLIAKLGMSGKLVRRTIKGLAGDMGLSGAVGRHFVLLLQGILRTSGAAYKLVSKTLLGSNILSGHAFKRVYRILKGVWASSGVMSLIRSQVFLAGGLRLSGRLAIYRVYFIPPSWPGDGLPRGRQITRIRTKLLRIVN